MVALSGLGGATEDLVTTVPAPGWRVNTVAPTSLREIHSPLPLINPLPPLTNSLPPLANPPPLASPLPPLTDPLPPLANLLPLDNPLPLIVPLPLVPAPLVRTSP